MAGPSFGLRFHNRSRAGGIQSLLSILSSERIAFAAAGPSCFRIDLFSVNSRICLLKYVATAVNPTFGVGGQVSLN